MHAAGPRVATNASCAVPGLRGRGRDLHPESGRRGRTDGHAVVLRTDTRLRDQATTKADGDGVRPTPGLELGEKVTNVRLHGLLGEIEALSDLAVDEAVGHELQDLELSRRRLLLQLAQTGGVNGITAPRARSPAQPPLRSGGCGHGNG